MEDIPIEIFEDCQDVYALLAKDSGLHISEVGKCLRMLNLNPSEQDVKSFIHSLELNDRESIEFEEFIKIFKACKEKCYINEEEVKGQILKLDKEENGTILSEDLKELLMTGEEPLNLHEAQALVDDFAHDGKIVIQEFFDAILFKN